MVATMAVKKAGHLAVMMVDYWVAQRVDLMAGSMVEWMVDYWVVRKAD